MRVLTWAARVAVFLLLAALAAKNVEPVTLRFYFDQALRAPLALVLLGAFALGALFGVVAMLGPVLRQRREISLLKKPAEPLPPAPPL
ncbi:MAG TPA: LapA family protein [Burkholderiales bacterium]|nr:LapA family protein [Burkholderiales bacterium]